MTPSTRPPSTGSGRRRSPLAAVGIAVTLSALALTACGGDDSDGSTDSAASPDPAAAAITIDHRYGSTTIDERPERVVAIDTQWTDVLIALGETPVGYAEDPTVGGEDFPWRGDELADSEALPIDAGIPYEQIAALEPDLIVITFGVQEESDYERLSEIAPTIPSLTDAEVEEWQDIAVVAGEIFDDEDAAEAMIAEAEQASADLSAELPGLEGQTFAMANYVPGDAIYVVSDPNDGASLLFEQLGLSITPTILAEAGGAAGRVELSLENISLLDSDVLVLFTNDTSPEDIPGYPSLPAVVSGAVAVLDYADVVGLNTPTPLSIPYSLELIRPALEAASGS
jgi:iron complex transport system substrate-binding protein